MKTSEQSDGPVSSETIQCENSTKSIDSETSNQIQKNSADKMKIECEFETEITDSWSILKVLLESNDAFETKLKFNGANKICTTVLGREISKYLNQIIEETQGRKGKKRKLVKNSRAKIQQKFNLTKNFPKLFVDKLSEYLLEKTKVNLNKELKDKGSWKRVNTFSKDGLIKSQVTRSTFNTHLISFMKNFDPRSIRQTKIQSSISILCYTAISRMLKSSIERIEKEGALDTGNVYISIDKSWPEVIITIHERSISTNEESVFS